MEVGNLKQKANRGLVMFVFGCNIIAVGLLYIMQKAEALGQNFSPTQNIDQYLN